MTRSLVSNLSKYKTTDPSGDPALNVTFDQPIDVIVNPADSPTIYNINYPTVSVIDNQVLSSDTGKFLIRHRDKGNIEFSFDASLATFITISKGNNYEIDGLKLTGKTLYFRSDKIGTIEILEWV